MKKILLLLLIALLAAAGVGFYLWNKPHRTAEDEDAVATHTATEICEECAANETLVWEKYKDQVIQIKGVVESISTDASGNIQIVLTSDVEMHTVSVTLKSGEKAEGIEPGMVLEIKGIFTGYLNDIFGEVILNQGVIVAITH